MFFHDRADAGRQLADRLEHLRDSDPIVLGLPRGGVPVAAQVAAALAAPLDVLVVRKLGVPFQPELAMGAIGEGGARVLNEGLVRDFGISDDEVAAVEAAERDELERRTDRYRRGEAPYDLTGRIAIVVDDGIATGATAATGCRIVRARGARRLILAVPVAPPGWSAELRGAADEFIALSTPADFLAVGQYYRDFSPTSDAEVIDCLDKGRHAVHRRGGRR
ncbi:MAG TPA: phosphoribosyltransferase family protein [Yinghuangia sp.]|uniref:phosphoribosyltransferase n=1 Tax=Yinghuangia sp. YIM S10712 TaxID=3436930 RepID=UPI002C8AAB93|nr:phosphoribosyltransferase family protein [Yinghuangia sp.]